MSGWTNGGLEEHRMVVMDKDGGVEERKGHKDWDEKKSKTKDTGSVVLCGKKDEKERKNKQTDDT